MAVGLHAGRVAGFEAGDATVVLGCGPVGLAAIGAARLDGVSPIIAADFSAKRRELTFAMGADEVVDPGEREVFDVYRELRGDRPAVVLECVGTPGMIERAMEGATAASQIVVVGVCMVEDQIRPSIGVEKQLRIQFALGYRPEEFAEAFEAIADGRLDVGPLVTGTVSLDGVADAFRTLADPQEHAKIVVLPQPE